MSFFPWKKSGKNHVNYLKLQLKFKRAHPTSAKIKAMKSYKNLDAICILKRDHSSKMEQIHPNWTTCTKSILILKNHVFFQNLPSITNSKAQGPLLLLLPSIPIPFFNISSSQSNYESSHKSTVVTLLCGPHDRVPPIFILHNPSNLIIPYFSF